MYFWRTSWSIISKTHPAHSCSSLSQWPANVPMAVTLATRSNGLVTDVFQFDRSWAKQFNVIDLIKCLLAVKVWDKKYNTLFYWIIAHVSSLDLVIQREIWNPESSMSWVLSTPLKAEVITLEAFFSHPSAWRKNRNSMNYGFMWSTQVQTIRAALHLLWRMQEKDAFLKAMTITLWKKLAYMNHGSQCLIVVRTNSMSGMASLWAWVNAVSL